MTSDSNQGEVNPEPNSASTDSTETGLWVSAHLALVEANATKWFEDLEPRAVHELYPKQVEAQKDIHYHSAYFTGQAAGAIIPSMQINLDDLGEPEVLENTELGRAVMAELKSRGVNFRFADSIPINHFQSIVLDVKDELLGQWTTDQPWKEAEGTPFHHHFKVFKNEAGEETGFWFVQLLASPLPLSVANEFEGELEGEIRTLSFSEEQLSQGMFSYGEVSTKVHLPILLKKLAYLGETPLPESQLMSFSRDLAFKDIPKNARPIPSYSILKDNAFLSFAEYDLETGELDYSYKSQIVPEMVVFGWRFGKESLDHISSYIPTIVDGCTRAVSTVADGYKNFIYKNTKIDYDSSLANPCRHYLDYDWSGSRLARPQWIPVTELGDIVATSKEALRRGEALLNAGELDDAWKQYRSVMNDGVGWYLASAINTLEYRWYIPNLVNEPSGLSDTEYYLKQAISLNVVNESTQALIYLGLAKMLTGDFETAQKILYGALERPDKFGTAEIQHYRSLIYAKQGDRAGQLTLELLVRQLGGFLAPAYIEEALNLGKTNSPDSEITRPPNCGACGTQFESEEVNFCSSCGVGREEVSISGENSIGKGNLNVGFVLEITSINEDLDQSMNEYFLADFVVESLLASGYPDIWRAPGNIQVLIDEGEFHWDLLVDPTSIFSYLSALRGRVSGDVISFEFFSDPNPLDINSSSWDIVRKRLRASVSQDFLLLAHKYNFESSGQTFFLKSFEIEGSNRLTIERLESALVGLQKVTKTSASAKAFLELFAPEVASIRFLPAFVSGHIWAQLLSGCDWNTASKILTLEGQLEFDAESFNWQVPAKGKNANWYMGLWAVDWFRLVRRSLNFTPWPWQTNSMNESNDPDRLGTYRAQVDRLLFGRQPAPQEKVAAIAMLYWLVDHEDSEDDEAPYTSDKVRGLIYSLLPDPLEQFIEDNLALIKQCFTALNLTAEEDGSDHYDSSLPEWAGSEGVMAGVKAPYGSSESTGHLLEFEPSLFEAVENLWPEFIAITSQKQV